MAASSQAPGRAQPTTTTLPMRELPGSYGWIPIISAIRDRYDFHYNAGGTDGFFHDRVAKYGSTVFRTNVAPGPFIAPDSRVIALLDAKAYPVLFDVSKVEKKNVFVGVFMPSTSLTGGYRVCAYLDPSEPKHAVIKRMLFELLASRKPRFIPEFRSSFFDPVFDKAEIQLAESGKCDYNKLNDAYGIEFLGMVYFGSAPSGTKELAGEGVAGTKASKWILFSLHSLMSLGLPSFLEEIFLHTFALPPFLIKSDYKALYTYFSSVASSFLDSQQDLLTSGGLSRDEACHNLLFTTCFNTYGGLKVLWPAVLGFLAQSPRSVHDRLAHEVRTVVNESGGQVTYGALEKMELVKSFAYESLRMDPPVKFQYGKAKSDLVIESHDAAFKVKKGEMLFGYQSFATRDERVFGPDAGQFVADRFVGEKGQKLLQYVVWSNGPETESPTVGNKQCAGKDFVVLISRLLLVEFFLRYDTFTADVGKILLGQQVTFTSLTKAGGFVIGSGAPSKA